MIKRELKHGKRVYSMEYHFMKSAKGAFICLNFNAFSKFLCHVILLQITSVFYFSHSHQYLSVGKNSYWDDDTHSMQLSFGVDEFLVFFCFALYKHRPSYDSVGFIYYYFNHFCVFLAFSP